MTPQRRTWLSGSGGDAQVDYHDLKNIVVRKILAFATRTRSFGASSLPTALRVKVSTTTNARESLTRFLSSLEFEEDIRRELLNRLAIVSADELPTLNFEIEKAEAFAVEVEISTQETVGRIKIQGGDLDGSEVELDGRTSLYHLGRGAWHGPGQVTRNDIVVCKNNRFVSRRAAQLTRAGLGFEITAKDQESMVVERDGKVIRPKNVRGGVARIESGDRIVFSGGAGELIVLILESDSSGVDTVRVGDGRG